MAKTEERNYSWRRWFIPIAIIVIILVLYVNAPIGGNLPSTTLHTTTTISENLSAIAEILNFPCVPNPGFWCSDPIYNSTTGNTLIIISQSLQSNFSAANVVFIPQNISSSDNSETIRYFNSESAYSIGNGLQSNILASLVLPISGQVPVGTEKSGTLWIKYQTAPNSAISYSQIGYVKLNATQAAPGELSTEGNLSFSNPFLYDPFKLSFVGPVTVNYTFGAGDRANVFICRYKSNCLPLGWYNTTAYDLKLPTPKGVGFPSG